MTTDDRVEIVGEGKSSGSRHIGKTGVIGATDGAYMLVYFDVLDSPYDYAAWFPVDSLELLKATPIDLSRLESADLWTAARAINDIITGYSVLQSLGLCETDDGVDLETLTPALQKEVSLRRQVAEVLGGTS